MGRVLLAVMWLVLAWLTPGHAQQPAVTGPPVTVLDVFLTFLVDLRAHMEACPATSPTSQPAVEDDWDEARSILLGSLWANRVSGEVVRRVEAILDGGGAEVDCGSETMAYGARLVGERGWTPPIKGALSDLGFTVVEKPASAAQWDELKSVLATERPLQARLFDCVAVVDPMSITFAASSWSKMLLEAGQAMVAAGLPRDEVMAEIDAADVSRLWTFPEDRAQRAELLAECEADKSWMDRFSQFATHKIQFETSRILGEAR